MLLKVKNLLLFIFVLFSFSAIAQTNPTGCIIVFPYGAVAAFPRVYTTLTSYSVPTTESADIQGLPVYDGLGAGVTVSYSCYRDPIPNSTRQCVVRGTSTQWYGGVLAQNFYQCPIDDYIPYILLAMAALGFSIIRKQAVRGLSNYSLS